MKTVIALLLLAPLAYGQVDRVDEFVARLDARVPELMLREVVPSVAVAAVHDGRVVTRTWGLADVATARIATNGTRYNVASVSKLLTAWAVMRLVEDGKVRLDDPIAKYIQREYDDRITIRRLLSHSSGLSMPAVPQYAPGEPLPSIDEMLKKDPLQLIDTPGKAHHYSGGGFALLQLLIEAVSGVSYEEFLQQQILKPLGMNHSSFVVPDAGAAVPYDAGVRPLPHYRFAAVGAAGLYTTIDDLAAFAAATVGRRPAPLSQESIALTQTPVAIEAKTPFRYGLGENLIALPSEKMTTGHAGSNDGWTCVLLGVPSTGDALVVLMNRSNAFPLYRDLMCEWLTAAAGENWPGFCGAPRAAWSKEDSAFVDERFASGSAAVLVAIGDEVVHRKAYGGTLTPETPFYLASLTKSFTSLAVLQLVAAGKMSLSDPISRYVPGVPEWATKATIEQLLSHTSGIPSYQQLIDWGSYKGMDNAGVIALLREKGKLLFEPGSKYAYSNSGYVLLANAVASVSGTSFNDYLTKHVLEPLQMRSTTVYDGSKPAPAGRAIGYEGKRLSDYLDVVLPNGKLFSFRSTTVGAGGMFSTVDDLFRFTRASLLPLDLQLLAITPRTRVEGETELPDTQGHGFGWFLSRRAKSNLIWNQGGFAGHKTMIVRIPQRGATIIILANAGETNVNDLAAAIADRVLD